MSFGKLAVLLRARAIELLFSDAEGVIRRNLMSQPLMSSEEKQRLGSHVPAERLEALNRAILETALDCIITMDAKGLVREFNPAAERVFGFTRADAVGRELAELIIPPSLREMHRRGLARYL